MKKFNTIISTCQTIDIEDIDTDQIIPARFLRISDRTGFGKFLFYDWRYDEKGELKESRYLRNFHQKNSQKILVAGNNFGCGSSREHAVWALKDAGFQVIISSSYGEIFYNNSLKNGLLPVILKPDELKMLMNVTRKHPSEKIEINLINQSVYLNVPGKSITYKFKIDPFRKACLLKGVDELGYILSFEKQIIEFEKSHPSF